MTRLEHPGKNIYFWLNISPGDHKKELSRIADSYLKWFPVVSKENTFFSEQEQVIGESKPVVKKVYTQHLKYPSNTEGIS